MSAADLLRVIRREADWMFAADPEENPDENPAQATYDLAHEFATWLADEGKARAIPELHMLAEEIRQEAGR